MLYKERSNEIYNKKSRLSGVKYTGCTTDLDIEMILDKSKKSRQVNQSLTSCLVDGSEKM